MIGCDSTGGGDHCKRTPTAVRLIDSEVGGGIVAMVVSTVGGSVGGAKFKKQKRPQTTKSRKGPNNSFHSLNLYEGNLTKLVLTECPDSDDLTEGTRSQLVLGQNTELVTGGSLKTRDKEVGFRSGHREGSPLMLPSRGGLHPEK